MLGPGDLHERIAVLTESIELAERAHAASIAFAGRTSLVHDLLELGDVVSAEREIDALARDPAHNRLPVRRWIVAVLRASLGISSGRGAEGGGATAPGP